MKKICGENLLSIIGLVLVSVDCDMGAIRKWQFACGSLIKGSLGGKNSGCIEQGNLKH